MIDDIQQDAETRMQKSIEALKDELAKVRTGRAHPSLLDHVSVDYYGSMVPLSQVANIGIEDSRTLSITPWQKPFVTCKSNSQNLTKTNQEVVNESNGRSGNQKIPCPPLSVFISRSRIGL